jgi:hypothetical protein
VIRTDVDNIHSVFFFLKQHLNRFGLTCSILFKNFDICELKIEDICDLQSGARHDWLMVGGRNGDLIGDFISQCLPSEQRVAELTEENENLQFGMEGGGEKMESSSVLYEGERRSDPRAVSDRSSPHRNVAL